MAKEITISGSLSFFKTGVTNSAVGKAATAVQVDVAGNAYIEASMATSTSPAAIPLGGVTTPRWAQFQNMDATDNISIRDGSGGTNLITMKPGDPVATLPLAAGAVPYAVASANTPRLDYLIVQA